MADEEEGVEPEDADEGHPYKEVFQAVLDHVRAAMQSNEIERQRECFEKALALIRGDEHLSRRNVLKLVLAGYEEDAGQLERAKALLLEVVHSLDAPSWRPHYMLGRIYASENSMQAAHDSLSRAVELGSHSFPDGDLHWTQSLLLRAQLNLALGRPELAMSDTSVLLQEAPQHRSPHREGLMIRGELSLQTRASFDAIKDFGVILSDESTFVDAEVARSVAYIQLMRKEIARRDLVHAQSVDTVRTYAALLRYAPYIESPSPAFASFVERRAAVEIPPFEEDNAALNNHVAAHTQEFTDLFKQVLQELQ